MSNFEVHKASTDSSKGFDYFSITLKILICRKILFSSPNIVSPEPKFRENNSISSNYSVNWFDEKIDNITCKHIFISLQKYFVKTIHNVTDYLLMIDMNTLNSRNFCKKSVKS